MTTFTYGALTWTEPAPLYVNPLGAVFVAGDGVGAYESPVGLVHAVEGWTLPRLHGFKTGHPPRWRMLPVHNAPGWEVIVPIKVMLDVMFAPSISQNKAPAITLTEGEEAGTVRAVEGEAVFIISLDTGHYWPEGSPIRYRHPMIEVCDASDLNKIMFRSGRFAHFRLAKYGKRVIKHFPKNIIG